MKTRVPTDAELAVANSLNKIFSANIPAGRHIILAAISAALRGHKADAEWIKQNVSHLAEDVQEDAYNRYLASEKGAWKLAFSRTFAPMINKTASAEAFALAMADQFFALDKFFLSRTQSRRSRAGTAFEIFMQDVFIRLGYPFTPQPKLDGNPDFVLPSIEHYRHNPLDVIVFTVKRSLRERWRQVATEATKGRGFFLATIDEKTSIGDIQYMQGERIFLVVPERIKMKFEHYRRAPHVISFEEFFRDHLDPAMIKWARNGAIKSQT
jgi:DNA-binding cell septation regulator SpoVG